MASSSESTTDGEYQSRNLPKSSAAPISPRGELLRPRAAADLDAARGRDIFPKNAGATLSHQQRSIAL
jgi:hypothetical protein